MLATRSDSSDAARMAVMNSHATGSRWAFLGRAAVGAWATVAGALGMTPIALPREAAHATSPSAHYVVSYIVSAAADSAAVVEDEAFPDRRHPTHLWHWRVFDPASGRDTLFLALPSFPTRVRWDPAFRFVEYAVGGRIERAAWRLGTRPQEQIRLPVDTCLCDFWSDSGGRWHVLTQVEVEEHPAPGYVQPRQFATRWDQETGAAWRAAARDSAYDPFGGCLEWKTLGTRPARVRLRDLLDSMRIEYHRDSTLRRLPGPDEEEPDVLVWVPSRFDPGIGLELTVGTGDSDHAMEPVVWLDRRQGRRRTLCPRGGTHDEASGQVAFSERRGFLLITAEYSGAFPIVADMRTGRVVFRVSRPSARAVWVPAPQ